MECNTWNEKGLLFLAQELDGEESRQFQTHLVSCEFCKKETELYRKEKELYFRTEMFEEEPSSAVDREILRVCSKPVRPTRIFATIPAMVKNTLYSLIVLAIGFSGGAYFVGMKLASDAKKNEKNAIVVDKNSVHPSSQTSSMAAHQEKADSSLKGDSAAHKPEVIKGRGDMSQQGVVPVDLQDDK